MEVIDKNSVKRAVFHRHADANKGTLGSLLTVCGCYSMAGAAIMAGKAALRSGIGLLKMAVPQSIYPIVASNILESIYYPVAESNSGTFQASNSAFLLEKAEESRAVLIGCGMCLNTDTQRLVFDLIEQCTVPMVLDADALNAVSKEPDILKRAKAPLLLTPHPGEMARLANCTIAQIQANRAEIAKAFAGRYSVILALKGAGTVVTDGERICTNPTGNAGMATGGSGDVLAGMTASLLAQNPKLPFETACAGVYLHGLAGDLAKEKFGEISMLPTDLISCIPLAFQNCHL